MAPAQSPLLDSDRASATWARLKEFYAPRLESLRTQLESAPNEKAADIVRGRIREVRALLKLDDKVPEFDFPPTDGQRRSA